MTSGVELLYQHLSSLLNVLFIIHFRKLFKYLQSWTCISITPSNSIYLLNRNVYLCSPKKTDTKIFTRNIYSVAPNIGNSRMDIHGDIST